MTEYCPICCEELNNENRSCILACNHQFCFQCLWQVINENKGCPLDRNKIKQVGYWDSNNQLVKASCEEFKIHILIYLQKIQLEEDFSNNLSIFTKKLIKISSNDDNNKEKYNINDRDGDCRDINNTKRLFLKFHFISFNELQMIVRGNERKRLVAINIITHDQFIRYLQCKMTACMKNFSKFEKEDTLKIIQQIRLNLVSGVVSHVTDNTQLYKSININYDGSNSSICLLCLKQINEMKYAKFIDCEHKICCECIDNGLIIHGSCPFHPNEIKRLTLHRNEKPNQMEKETESIAHYLQRKKYQIVKNLYGKVFDVYDRGIDEIKSVKKYIPKFINLTIQLHQSINVNINDSFDIDIYNKLQSYTENKFNDLNTLEFPCDMFDDTTIMDFRLYRLYLMSGETHFKDYRRIINLLELFMFPKFLIYLKYGLKKYSLLLDIENIIRNYVAFVKRLHQIKENKYLSNTNDISQLIDDIMISELDLKYINNNLNIPINYFDEDDEEM